MRIKQTINYISEGMLPVLTGLIVGIACISFMNLINHSMNISRVQPENLSIFYNSMEGTIYLIGKVLALFSGIFCAGAVSSLIKATRGYRSSTIIGCIIMMITVIDSVSHPYPVWYILISLIICIPSALTGTLFIRIFQTSKN